MYNRLYTSDRFEGIYELKPSVIRTSLVRMPTIPFLHESSEKRERRWHPPQDFMTTVAGQNNKNPDLRGVEVMRFLSTSNHLLYLTSPQKRSQQVGSGEPKMPYIAAIQVGELWSIIWSFQCFSFSGESRKCISFFWYSQFSIRLKASLSSSSLTSVWGFVLHRPSFTPPWL